MKKDLEEVEKRFALCFIDTHATGKDIKKMWDTTMSPLITSYAEKRVAEERRSVLNVLAQAQSMLDGTPQGFADAYDHLKKALNNQQET